MSTRAGLISVNFSSIFSVLTLGAAISPVSEMIAIAHGLIYRLVNVLVSAQFFPLRTIVELLKTGHVLFRDARRRGSRDLRLLIAEADIFDIKISQIG